jgi:hypothetical protein
LRPVCWETPHYAASQGDYHIFGDHFAAGYERPLVFPVSADAPPVFAVAFNPPGQPVPFFTPRGSTGIGIIPDALGHIDRQTPGHAPADLLAAADRLSVLRDGVASFFFHAGVIPTSDLLEVVDGLLDRGYSFITPADLLGDDDDDNDDDNSDDDASPDDDDADDDDDNGSPGASADDDSGDNGCGC